jgi:ABC-2 type transport system permease protein
VQRFKAGLINELSLMIYRKKVVMYFIFSALLPILLALSLHALQPYLGLVAVSGSFPIQMLDIYSAVWIPLFIITIAGDLFPNEIASRTLKLALLRPNTRLQVFFTKVTALGIGIGALLLVLGVITLICNLFAGSPASISEWINIIKAYMASFISMLALLAMFVFVAQFFKSASGFMVFSIVLYAAAKIAPFFVKSISAFSPFSYTDWHMLWLSNTVSAGRLMTSSLFLASSCILFFTLGYYIFDRKEV